MSKAIELLQALREKAKSYRKEAQVTIAQNSHMNKVKRGELVEQEDIDAVLVDFINSIASDYGIDYGLYTTDLNE